MLTLSLTEHPEKEMGFEWPECICFEVADKEVQRRLGEKHWVYKDKKAYDRPRKCQERSCGIEWRGMEWQRRILRLCRTCESCKTMMTSADDVNEEFKVTVGLLQASALRAFLFGGDGQADIWCQTGIFMDYLVHRRTTLWAVERAGRKLGTFRGVKVCSFKAKWIKLRVNWRKTEYIYVKRCRTLST